MGIFAESARVRREHGFRLEEEHTNITNVTFLLLKRAYSIISVVKEGVTLTTPADFSFKSPKKIILTSLPNVDDFIEVKYATELDIEQIDDAISHGDQDIRAVMVKRFGQAKLTDWETAPPAYLVEIGTKLAGLYAERMMIRQNHSYDTEAFMNIQKSMDTCWKKLGKVDLGILQLVGETPISDEVLVGRTGDQFFGSLEDITDVDYETFFRQRTLRDRRERSTKDLSRDTDVLEDGVDPLLDPI